MTQLIACLSTGKGSWAQLTKLINSQEWEKVFLITNAFGKERYTPQKNTELLAFDFNQTIESLQKEIESALKGKVTGFEVAINICSGTGKEHAALITAVQRLGVGMRFVDFESDKLVQLI